MKQTPFEELAERLRKKLTSGPVDAWKARMIGALQNIEVSPHKNRFEALQAFQGALACHDRHQEDASRLLTFISGALLSDDLTTACWRTLAASAQVVVTPPVPPHARD